jgi:hypothetical protein
MVFRLRMEEARKEIHRMMKRCLAVVLLVLATAAAHAGPLHSSDSDYRGAFTILAAGHVEGASARYMTEVVLNNESDHAVWIRLESYSMSGGYREAILPNIVQPGAGSKLKWGMLARDSDNEPVPGRGPDAVSSLLGDDLGALRVVAVRSDGSDDLGAKISGYGRLWILPRSGGRLSEMQPGFTDAELTGKQRRKGHSGTATVFNPFDAYGSRINFAVTNFDTNAPLTVVVGPHTATSPTGPSETREAITIEVPAGSTRMVPLPVVGLDDKQVIVLNAPSGATNWISYASVIDAKTDDVSLRFDTATERAVGSRR